MASVAGTKRKAENKSCKLKYKALKELEKGTTLKMLLPNLEFLAAHFQLGKKTRRKYSNNITVGSCQNVLNQKKYEQVNKAVYKWLVMLRSENIPISGPMLKEKTLSESYQCS